MSKTTDKNIRNEQKLRFDSLDTIRGFLAVSVALGHLIYLTPEFPRYPLSFILSVDFFFALSGFVISHSYFTSKDKHNWIINFPIKRALRLFPLYITCFLVTVLISKPLLGHNVLDMGLSSVISALFLIQTTGITRFDLGEFGVSSIGIGWALSIEMWFAILFFLIVYSFKKNLSGLIVVLMISSLISLQLMSTYSPNFFDVHYHKLGFMPYGILRGIIGFSLGTITYILFTRFDKIKFASFAEIFILLAIILLFRKVRYDRGLDFLAPYIFSIFIFIYSYQQGIVSKILRIKPFIVFGKASFGIYLIHPILMNFISYFEISKNYLNVSLYIITLIAISILSLKYIEEPAMKLFKNLQLK